MYEMLCVDSDDSVGRHSELSGYDDSMDEFEYIVESFKSDMQDNMFVGFIVIDISSDGSIEMMHNLPDDISFMDSDRKKLIEWDNTYKDKDPYYIDYYRLDLTDIILLFQTRRKSDKDKHTMMGYVFYNSIDSRLHLIELVQDYLYQQIW